jgi:hypothetical protein
MRKLMHNVPFDVDVEILLRVMCPPHALEKF